MSVNLDAIRSALTDDEREIWDALGMSDRADDEYLAFHLWQFGKAADPGGPGPDPIPAALDALDFDVVVFEAWERFVRNKARADTALCEAEDALAAAHEAKRAAAHHEDACRGYLDLLRQREAEA